MIAAVTLTIASTFFNALGFSLFKKASRRFRLSFDMILNKHLVLGALSFGTGVIMYIAALTMGDLSFLYPLAAFQYVWLIFFGYRMREQMRLRRLAGIILLIIGVVLVGMS